MTELTDTLINRCFGPQEGAFQIKGVPVRSLAERYGTPLFVYDRSLFDRRLDSLRSALPEGVEVYYSVKANPSLAIICHFVRRGCGLEIASVGEFTQAIAAGCSADQIVFAGPGKTDAELEVTLSRGIGEIHVESSGEAERIAAICKRTGVRARVALRVNPTGDAQGGAMRMGGKAAPFGVDEEHIEPVVQYLSSEACFDFCGIHMSAGTQILDYSVLMTQYRKAIQIARAVISQIGRPLQTVDFGGGLGIPCFEGEHQLDIDAFNREFTELIIEARKDPNLSRTRFLIEPGRFLVGEAGIYVTRIVDIKQSRGKKYLIVDGGMNHHLAASGNLGQTIKRNYPIVLLRKPGDAVPADSIEETVDIVGPLCTPLDTLGRSVTLPAARIGDFIGILQSGAYARTASPLGFLSHPSPPEVWIDHGKDFLIRSRGEAQDMMRGMFLPPSPIGPEDVTKKYAMPLS